MTEAVSGVSQTDYMKLFMQELTYQDPLKPVDNREFMAQMAQFSALEQAQQSTKYLGDLLGTTNSNQGLMLLGKHVKFVGSNVSLQVNGVSFPINDTPKLIMTMNGAQVLKELKEITEVGL